MSTTSDIDGTGYGSCHLWVRGKTAQVGAAPPELKWTSYRCSNCGEIFIHRYALIRNIFEAMEKANVKNTCD